MGVDADKAIYLGVHSKRILVFLIPDASPEAPSMDAPLTLRGGSGGGRAGVRVLMDEVRAGRYCHAPIDESVRELFFVPKGESSSSITLRGGRGETIGVLPETYEHNGRIPTTLAVVPVEKGYLEFPRVGYHGTSEIFEIGRAHV
jgi:hypothetical protein